MNRLAGYKLQKVYATRSAVSGQIFLVRGPDRQLRIRADEQTSTGKLKTKGLAI